MGCSTGRWGAEMADTWNPSLSLSLSHGPRWLVSEPSQTMPCVTLARRTRAAGTSSRWRAGTTWGLTRSCSATCIASHSSPRHVTRPREVASAPMSAYATVCQ